jgi:hypothetical protein
MNYLAEYQQRIIELTEQNNSLTKLCYDLADKLTLQQEVSQDDYLIIRKQIEQLKDKTINDNIFMGNKLLNEIMALKKSLNGYLILCMDEIVAGKKIKEAIELHKNLLNNGFVGKNNKFNEFVKENSIKKFKYNCSKHRDKITDEFLLTMPYLEVLDLNCEKCGNCCRYCPNITDHGIQHLTQLRKLNCWNCPNITDLGIKHLTMLTILYCHNCPNVSDDGIKYLTHLTELYCGNCPNITDNSIQNLTRLTKLQCNLCPKITNNGIQNLVLLIELSCLGCPEITDKMEKKIKNKHN